MLIDFDNVTMGIRSDLQEELKNLLSSDIIKGKVAVRRAYADWRRYPQYIVPLTESSIDLIFAPAYGSSKKNATDIRLAIDALELVFTRPEIGTFVLLSGDSDFSSMVIKLKEYGKYVIGVGIRESSSDLLVMNCDEYYSYNALAGLVKSGDDETSRWDPWELCTESVTRMKRNGDVMRSDRLKQVMQEIDSSFDEKNLGFPKFSRFVQEAQHRGLVRVTKLDSGQLEIDTPDGTTPVAVAVTGEHATALIDGEPRRELTDREREERRNRRGRRGRGRDRFDRDRGPRGEEGVDGVDAEPGVDGGVDAGVDADVDAGDEIDVTELVAALPFAPLPVTADVTAAPANEAGVDGEVAVDGALEARDRGRSRRGRGRERFRDREGRETAAPAAGVDVAEAAGTEPAVAQAAVVPVTRADRQNDAAEASLSFGAPVAAGIGSSGERLTRSEAFDLVRRAVESLVEADDATSASAARQRAFELLARDSESLSVRNFERILQDAHDANMIDLRRRGHDWEVARAAEAASIVDQLKVVDDAQKAEAKAAAALLPQAPRGMGARGVGPRGINGRGKVAAGPSAELMMVGVVGGSRPAAPVAVTPPVVVAPVAAAVVPAPKAVAAPVVVAPVAAPVVPAPVAPVVKAPAKTAKAAPTKTAKAPAAKVPATKAPAKAAAPAKKAPSKPAKAPAKAATAPVKAAKPAAKAAAPAAAKKAAKTPAKKASNKR